MGRGMASSFDTAREGTGARDHLTGALVAGGSLALLVTSAVLAPSDAGHGTHQQLGLPACGWASGMGFPCPTCGMTTSFAHAADGGIIAAAAVQPAGLVLALLVAGAFWAGLAAAVSGGSAATLGRPLWRKGPLIGGGALVLAAWIYKMVVWIPGA